MQAGRTDHKRFHHLPQEAPQAWAQAVIDVDGY
jgi:hypothetical protein